MAMHAMHRESRRPRTFVCRDDLYGAFEKRAHELRCSTDWLLAEAMKRLLADATLALPSPQSLPSPPGARPPRVTPPPPPARPAAIALRSRQKRVVVDRERFVIGRNARDAHFVVRDSSVSRQHAMIERGADAWYVIDMASTNGVSLNGSPVTRAALRPGDVLVIGPMTLTVERA
jgi:pSer/pThr/pTyr-binding forkhead associated (FHA) protein